MLRARGAHALEIAGLERAQQARLLRWRNVADLVEEQRAAVRELEAPVRSALASVNAPFTWPNISLSNTVSGSPPAFTAMKDFSARSDQSWMSLASRLLPVPGSPVISTLASERATWRAIRTTSCIARELATRSVPSAPRRIAFSSARRRPRRRASASCTWLRSTDRQPLVIPGLLNEVVRAVAASP